MKFETESEECNSQYIKKEYWDKRFETEVDYDWLTKFTEVKELILPFINLSDKILIVGCGNSSFSADLYDLGYLNITNIDFSSILIEKMQSLHIEKRPNMKWLCMDMTDMTFMNATFDVVIDKAAMDALMVNEGDVWDPEDEVKLSAHKMCSCISRILKADVGKFIQISFAQPHFRSKYLMGLYSPSNRTAINPYDSYKGYNEIYGWNLIFTPIIIEKGCLNSFLYVMKRE
jgi:2-polyprenyl-3-methyl-5-hydroxy-6-metoxy-1,4-benzoquinol methylase